MKPNQNYTPQLIDYFKLFQLFNSPLLDDNNCFHFSNDNNERISASINYDEAGTERLILTNQHAHEITQQTTDNLLQILKENLANHSQAIFSIQENIQSKAFPPELMIDEYGNLSGVQSNGREFSDRITDFINYEESRIASNFYTAFCFAQKKFQQLPASLLNELEEESYHMTKSGKKTIDEYVQYLGSTNVLLDDEVNVIRHQDNYINHKDSKTFFDIFSIKFNHLLSRTHYIFDKKAHEVTDYPLHFIETKSAQAFAKDIYKATDSNIRFEDDKNGKHAVGNTTIHYAETIGINPKRKQEDHFLIAEGNDLNWQKIVKKLEEIAYEIREKQEEFLATSSSSNITKKQQKELSDKCLVGSTVLMANYAPNQTLTIANCGDSRASLFIVGPDNQIKNYVPLTLDHNTNSLLERKRIERLGGQIENARIIGQSTNIAIARSFGDSTYKGDNNQYLISDEVDIYEYSIDKVAQEAKRKYGEKSRLVMVMSCDGLYEGNISEESYITALNKWFQNENNIQAKWHENIATYLQDCALSFGSQDNITVCAMDVTNAPDKNVVTGIFDGHGGNMISQTLLVESVNHLAKDNDSLFVSSSEASSILGNKMKRKMSQPLAEIDTDIEDEETVQSSSANKRRKCAEEENDNPQQDSPHNSPTNPQLVGHKKMGRLI